MPYGTVNADIVSAANGGSIGAGSGLAFVNRLINGDMRIDQRNAGASVSFSSSFAYYLDRFGGRLQTSTGSTIAQSSVAPSGFNKSLLVTIGTGASATSSQLNAIYQAIEGYNVADMNFGTANAKTFTLSFWVRSSLTGTFGGAFQNNANNRSYPFTYTISAANTWEQKSITVAGDTTGTWETTNNSGLTIWFDLGSGSNFQGTAGAWAGADYRSATGATSVVGTNGATFYLTGVQLQKGDTATSFDYRPYGTELALCQRYCISYGLEYTNARIAYGGWGSSTSAWVSFPFPVTMRAAPSFTPVANGTLLLEGVAWYAVSATPVLSGETSNKLGIINLSVSSSAASAGQVAIWGSGTIQQAKCIFSSEL
jgi:hypothetical protein